MWTCKDNEEKPFIRVGGYNLYGDVGDRKAKYVERQGRRLLVHPEFNCGAGDATGDPPTKQNFLNNVGAPPCLPRRAERRVGRLQRCLGGRGVLEWSCGSPSWSAVRRRRRPAHAHAERAPPSLSCQRMAQDVALLKLDWRVDTIQPVKLIGHKRERRCCALDQGAGRRAGTWRPSLLPSLPTCLQQPPPVLQPSPATPCAPARWPLCWAGAPRPGATWLRRCRRRVPAGCLGLEGLLASHGVCVKLQAAPQRHPLPPLS